MENFTPVSGLIGGLLAPRGSDTGWRVAFVAGLLFGALGYALATGRDALVSVQALPTKSALDGRLLGGATLFGVGWGLSGFCPGPAVAALVTGLAPVLAFAAAMLAGMVLYTWVFERPESGGVKTQPTNSQARSGLSQALA